MVDFLVICAHGFDHCVYFGFVEEVFLELDLVVVDWVFLIVDVVVVVFLFLNGFCG